MHIYVIFQYSIILEIIICRISVTLFVALFHYSFFFQIALLWMKNIFVKFVVLATCPKTIHTTKCTFDVIFYVIILSNLYFVY